MTSARISVVPGLCGEIPQALVVKPNVCEVAPPVVAVHGIRREAEVMADLLAPAAVAAGRTLVLPIFDKASWKRFQKAACSQRSDIALLRLLAALRHQGVVEAGRFDLSGFSGGGQFAHRFAWLYPHLVRRLCAAAPGWWTFPDPSMMYPLGMGDEHDAHNPLPLLMRRNLAHFLDRDIVVRVGCLDIERDENLRQNPEIDAQQGRTRVDRARTWSASVHAACEAFGIEPRVDFAVLPDCAHSFTDCVTQAGLDADFVVAAQRTDEHATANASQKRVA